MSSICTCTVHTYLSSLVRNGNQLKLGLVHAKTLYEDRGVQTSYGEFASFLLPHPWAVVSAIPQVPRIVLSIYLLIICLCLCLYLHTPELLLMLSLHRASTNRTLTYLTHQPH